MKLSKDDLKVVSFPDTEVTSMEVDLANSTLSIKCLDGLLARTTGNKCIEDVVIRIENFDSITAEEYIEQTTQVKPDNDEYFLKDICEFLIEDNKIILKGFSQKRGYWSEYHVVGGNLVVSYAKETLPFT